MWISLDDWCSGKTGDGRKVLMVVRCTCCEVVVVMMMMLLL